MQRNRETEKQRNRACIYSSHGDLSKGWWCQDFFSLPSWPLVGVVFYFLPSGALENIKFLSPWMLPRKMGSQDELPEVCEVQEPWAFWILECWWFTGSSNWKYHAHGKISIYYIHYKTCSCWKYWRGKLELQKSRNFTEGELEKQEGQIWEG